jgi:hypothetical protein
MLEMVTSEDICLRVLDADPMIRFAAVASIEADITAMQYRKGVEPLLNDEESTLSVTQSLMRAAIRRTLEHKLGRTIYATAVYEKVKRATISMFDVHLGKETGLLMISVEKEANLESLVENKILPLVENY